jgi:hypothetical protein
MQRRLANSISGEDKIILEIPEIPGSHNGSDGGFPLNKNPGGSINHRRFEPNNQ